MIEVHFAVFGGVTVQGGQDPLHHRATAAETLLGDTTVFSGGDERTGRSGGSFENGPPARGHGYRRGGWTRPG